MQTRNRGMDTWNRLTAVRRLGGRRNWVKEGEGINQRNICMTMDMDNGVVMARWKGEQGLGGGGHVEGQGMRTSLRVSTDRKK